MPNAFKHAKLSVLRKPGKDPAKSKSYRGINLLSCLGKLIEQQVEKIILKHINTSQNM